MEDFLVGMNIFVVPLFLLFCCLCTKTTLSRLAKWRRFHDGKFIVGALFPITQGPNCDTVREEGLILAEVFARTVLNQNNGPLSQGPAIGYDIRDTCSSPVETLKEMMDILEKNDRLSSKNCSLTQGGNRCGVVAVVGPDLSSGAMVTSGVLSAYGIPQVRLKFARLFYM